MLLTSILDLAIHKDASMKMFIGNWGLGRRNEGTGSPDFFFHWNEEKNQEIDHRIKMGAPIRIRVGLDTSQ